jgi:NADH dehydrogenase
VPIFGVIGDGRYRLQPIYVDDLAKLAVEHGRGRENTVINAIGPETFCYRDLVAMIGRAIGKPRAIVSVPRWLGYASAWVIGKFVGDVVVTRDEIEGLAANLLCVDAPPTGTTSLADWAAAHADTLGRTYASELARRKDRVSAYK